MNSLMLHLEILGPAMAAGLLVLGTHVPLGREVLRRGIIFLDLAIAQIAAFGIVLANTLWQGDHGYEVLPPTIVAVIAAVTGSLLLYTIRNIEVRLQEACIGILFVLAATGIILLLSADPHGGERLKEILVGQILWLQTGDLLQLLFAFAPILYLWIYWREKLGEWLFYPLFAITITLSTQVVGVFLVFASLIIPAVATLGHDRALPQAFAIGVCGYASGLIASALLDLPAGAAIVWCLALIAGAHVLLRTALITKSALSLKERSGR